MLSSIFSSNDDNKELGSLVLQGNKLLNHRKKMLKVLNNSKMVEGNTGFDPNHTRINEESSKELEELILIEDQYNKILGEYTRAYEIFSKKYYTARDAVKSCIAKCRDDETHPSSKENYNELRGACVTGCKLKGPVISECENNWGKDCDEIGKNICFNGEVQTGGISKIESSEYKDASGKSASEGCCNCGGGSKMGSEKVRINNVVVKNCDYYEDESLNSACANANYQAILKDGNIIEAKKLYDDYNSLIKLNNQLMEIASKLYNKIKKLNKLNLKIETEKYNSDSELLNELKIFEEKYKLKNVKLSPTHKARMEDIMLRKSSNEFEYYIFLFLAISFGVFAYYRMRR